MSYLFLFNLSLINIDKTFHFYFMVDGSGTGRAKLERNEPLMRMYEFRMKTTTIVLGPNCVSM